MAGGLLQLVANSGAIENIWINGDPQITFFKKVFRRHTPFATELVPIKIKNGLNFGGSANVVIPLLGDLAYRIFLVFDLPLLSARFNNTKSTDICNLINSTVFTDTAFGVDCKNCIYPSNLVEYDRLFNLIDDTDIWYDSECSNRLHIIDALKKYVMPNIIPIQSISQLHPQLDSETYPKQSTDHCVTDNFALFKIDLANQWIMHKQEYYPIYELLKFIYLSERDIMSETNVMDGSSLTKYINNDIFNRLLPNIKFDSIHEPFDTDFHLTLNSYNAVINVLASLGKTVPIVIVKPYLLTGCSDGINTSINYPAIIDPNFKTSFMLNIAGLEKPIENPNFIPFDFVNTFEQMYPTNTTNPYLRLINTRAITMMNNISNSIERLYQAYRHKLFNATSSLFFNNSSSPSNIYGYIVPDNCNNVFNMNIWYFYFFKYLDYLDENAFIDYIGNTEIALISDALIILKTILLLLKINLEYYMIEISYLLNDLYAGSPLIDPDISMKNYMPTATSEIHGLFGTTIIFHRNHVPTILEMFQYIYHFIATIDIDTINTCLDTHLSEIDGHLMAKVRNIGLSLYNSIFKYFMDKYDSFNFEAPANFCLNECDSEINVITMIYVKQFLNGNSKCDVVPCVSQMEFYFTAEMINIREQQKFYHSILDAQYITDNIGQTVADLVKIATDQWRTDSKTADNLYYSTSNIKRYYGQSYVDTCYHSRNFGLVTNVPLHSPVPLPPTSPYGINPNYYNHHGSIIDFAVLPITNDNILQMYIPVDWRRDETNCCKLSKPIARTDDSFQLFDIDYFRIKHQVLHQNKSLFLPKYIDEHDVNLLKTLVLSKKLKQNFIFDPNLLHWLWTSVFFILKRGTIDVNDYFSLIEESIHNHRLMITHQILDQVIIAMERLYHDVVGITADRLLAYNSYVKTVCSNTNDILSKRVSPTGAMDTNIVEKIETLRDNYIAQYFYYVKYYDSISSAISNMMDGSSIQMVYNLLTKINSSGADLTLLNYLSPLVFIYPDMYPKQIQAVDAMSTTLDDFSKYIFKLTTPLITSIDVLSIINTTFNAVQEIYRYTIDKDMVSDICSILSKYQLVLLKKNSISNEIINYLKCMPNQSITDDNMDNLIHIAGKYGIDKIAYRDYLIDRFIPIYIHHRLRAYAMINNDMDYFLTGHVCIKDIIMLELQSIGSNRLISHFGHVDNEYYAYIYFFINYLAEHKLSIDAVVNPLINANLNITTTSLVNLMEYLMDYVWDCSMTSGNPDIVSRSLGYDDRPSIIINRIHAADTSKVTKETVIINALANNHVLDLAMDELEEHDTIINLLKDIAAKGLILINQQKNELNAFQTKLYDILYRSGNQCQAKSAWIRKLGHYLVESCTLKCNNDVIDHHISDWYESHHEVSKKYGIEPAYLKMIGHREDLIVFDDNVKKSYTVVIPFVFYFNKHPALSLPLNASFNSQYSISIKLRDLEDVAYKEQFSDYIGAPTISNSHLMVEYIYLSNEERKIFITNKLEYVIDQLQHEIFTLTDNKMDSMYCTAKSTYLTRSELDATINPTIIFYTDYAVTSNVNKSGIKRLTNSPVYQSPIHHKIITIENHFNHPSKLMIVLIKPLVHTDVQYRSSSNPQYFHGEKQWDNYGLYSYYNHSKLLNVKKSFYQKLHHQVCDIDDTQFGFINVLNLVLLDCTDETIPVSHTWIDSNKSLFLEKLQYIKDVYRNSHAAILSNENTIKLKENLISLKIDFAIDQSMLHLLVNDVFKAADIDVPSVERINAQFHSESDALISFDTFTNGIVDLASNYITNAILSASDVIKHVDRIYSKYNDARINCLINDMIDNVEINNDKYNFAWIINSLYNNSPQTTISQIKQRLDTLTQNELAVLNSISVTNLAYKDILYQLSNMNRKSNIMEMYLNLIPYDFIKAASHVMLTKLNSLINNHKIQLVDYNALLIPNPKINPLLSGHLNFNGCNIMPESSDGIVWSDLTPYIYCNHTPNTGINIHSWSFDPLNPFVSQSYGTANLSCIDKFMSHYNIHPAIDNNNPAIVVSMISSVNIVRYLSGMCGLAWN